MKCGNIIKRGQIGEALQFMEEGELKTRYEELQNIINVGSTGNYGARGVQNTRPL
jgi:hypothetical protein